MLPSWLQGSDPHCTLNVFWGQPGTLATVSKFQRVLQLQEVRRWGESEYVYRVAWRNIRDWVMAQLALYETEIVEMPQVFLPFATDAKGQTLYEKMVEGKFLLGDGQQE